MKTKNNGKIMGYHISAWVFHDRSVNEGKGWNNSSKDFMPPNKRIGTRMLQNNQ